MQKVLSGIFLAVIAFFGFHLFKDQINLPKEKTETAQTTTVLGGVPARSTEAGRKVRIASFNIQVFGDKKASKSDVMGHIAKVIQKFDVLAIQEIRTKNGEFILRKLVNTINKNYNRNYAFLIGPRLGNTISKEQYAFIYDAASVEIDHTAAYTLNDPPVPGKPGGYLHREPLVAQFRVRGPKPADAFTFILVNIHTDPDVAQEEVNVLADVYRVVKQHSAEGTGVGEDDVIILGDLNRSSKQLGRLGEISGIYPVIQGTKTNTRQTKEYDNIILHSPSTTEFTGNGGVFGLMRAFNLTEEAALKISDHFPIWAEFEIYESRGQNRRVATLPGAKKQ